MAYILKRSCFYTLTIKSKYKIKRWYLLPLAMMLLLPFTSHSEPLVNDSLVLEPVIVSVQKRNESSKDVPIGMTVLDESALDNTHAGTLDEMQALVPNFSISKFNGDNTISIRGIGGGGRNIGFDPRVGVYLDGVYMGQSQALLMPLLEIERIEVLRGPQGYLFGRNTDAGAVNITSKAPSGKFEGYFQSTYASYQTYKNQGSVSGSISESAQAKLSMGYETRDGFSKNLYNNETQDGINRFVSRAQLSMQPNDRLNIDVYADYAKINQNSLIEETTTAMFGVPYASGPLPNYTINSDGNHQLTNRLSGINLNAQYSLANDNMITSISGYRNTHQARLADDDFTTADLLDLYFRDDFKQISQEVRIASPSDNALRYVAGVYLMHEKAESYRSATLGKDASALVNFPGIAAPIVFDTLFGLTPGALVPVAGSINTRSYAAFGSVDYDVAPFATLNLGARYTHENKDLEYQLDGTQSGALAIASVNNYQDSFSDHHLSPMVGMTFKLNQQHNLYLKYASGFKSGGWNVDFLTNSQIANGFRFNKETVDSYEIGLKGNSANKRMQYDVALFLSRYNDYQVFQLVKVGAGNELQLHNAAQAESKGLEGHVTALIADGLKMGASLGLLDATYSSFPDALKLSEDAAGRPLSEAPKVTAALTMQYTFSAPSLAGSITLYGEDSYRSKSYSGLDSDPSTFEVPSHHLINARAAYLNDNKHLELSLYATNLFDENYITFHGRDFLGAGVIKRGDPQMIGVEVTYSL